MAQGRAGRKRERSRKTGCRSGASLAHVQRRILFWVIAAAVALAAVMSLRSGDQAQIEEALAGVARALGQGEAAARNAVESRAEAQVRLDLGADTEQLGRDELAGKAAAYALEHGGIVIDVTNVEVHVHDARASVSGLLVISDSQLGDLHAEQRPFSANLTRADRWRIEQLTVGVARKHLPEARP
jgi:hypothetical protein